MVNTENLKQGSAVADQVQLLLRNGENDKAMDLLGMNYGPLARNAMEKVLKYSNLSQDELVRVFGKISDILENVADKISKNKRLNDIKERLKSEQELAEDAAEYAAIRQEALERRLKFEQRMQEIDEQKRKMEEERRQLLEQKRRAKDAAKRREIEERLKRLEKRKQYLEEERRNLEKLREENANSGRNSVQAAGHNAGPAETGFASENAGNKGERQEFSQQNEAQQHKNSGRTVQTTAQLYAGRRQLER